MKAPSSSNKGVYLGPRLRRLRRDLGLTQMEMASDLEISPSYIALMERNQRPVTAEVLLKLARTYKMDMSDLVGDETADHSARLRSVLEDPLFADIDFHSSEIADIVSSFPSFSEAMLQLYTAHREAQLALADNRPNPRKGGSEAVDPLAATRRFLAARRNCFPALDAIAERLGAKIAEKGGFQAEYTGPGSRRFARSITRRRLPSLETRPIVGHPAKIINALGIPSYARRSGHDVSSSRLPCSASSPTWTQPPSQRRFTVSS